MFEPMIDPLTPLPADNAQAAARAPRWKELEFLSRVVAFSGPADGVLVPRIEATNSKKVDGRRSLNITTVVCLFADGVYKFRVRIWTTKDGKVGDERSAVGTYEGEREAICTVHTTHEQ